MKRLIVMCFASTVFWGCGGGDKSDGPAFSLASSKLGTAVGFVDVDGDGSDDAVVGAPSANKDQNLGLALVYKGVSIHDIASVTPTALTGDNSFGSSFVNLGDVDVDSKNDYAIGAVYGDGDDVSMSGSVHIFKGGSNGQLIKKLIGELPMDRFGMSLATGDLNGDGKNDLIVGAPFNTPSPALYQAGSVYVYLAPEFGAPIKLASSSKNKNLGWTVATGDINKDGVSDLLISASGKVLGYYGKEGFAPTIDTPDVTISSAATDFGRSIAVIDDVNSDGFKDIAIGAPKATVGTNRDTGMLFLVAGGNGKRTVDIKDLNAMPADVIVRVDGANLFDRFGSSILVVDAGDEDAKLDLVVTAPLADADDVHLAGKIYLFKGNKLGSAMTLADAVVFHGKEKYQGFGTLVAAAPEHHLLVGMPSSINYNGDAAMVDLTGKHHGMNKTFFGKSFVPHMVGDMSGNGGGNGSDNHEHDHK